MAAFDDAWDEAQRSVGYDPSEAVGPSSPAVQPPASSASPFDSAWEEALGESGLRPVDPIFDQTAPAHRPGARIDPASPEYQMEPQHEVGADIPYHLTPAARALNVIPGAAQLRPVGRGILDLVDMGWKTAEALDPGVTPEQMADPNRQNRYTRAQAMNERVRKSKLLAPLQDEVDHPLAGEIVQSATVSAALPVALAAGGVPAALAAIPTVGLFAGAQYSDALGKAKREGLNDPAAKAEAGIEGVSEGAWEWISNMALLGPLGRGVTKSAAKAIGEAVAKRKAGTISAMAFKDVLKGNLTRDFVKAFITETGTELANTTTQYGARKLFGVQEDVDPDTGAPMTLGKELRRTAEVAGGVSGIYGAIAAALGVKGANRARAVLADAKAAPRVRMAMKDQVVQELRPFDARAAAVLNESWTPLIEQGKPIDLEQAGIDETDPRAQVPSPQSLAVRTAEIRTREDAMRADTPKATTGPAVRSTSSQDLLDFLRANVPDTVDPEQLTLRPAKELNPAQAKAQEEDAAAGLVTVFYDGPKDAALSALSGGPKVSFVPANLSTESTAFKSRHEKAHALDARPELDPLTRETRRAIAQAIPGADYAAHAQDLEVRRAAAGLEPATAAEEFDELAADRRARDFYAAWVPVAKATPDGPNYATRRRVADAAFRNKLNARVARIAAAEPGAFQRLKERLRFWAATSGLPVDLPGERGTAAQWSAVAEAALQELRGAETTAARTVREQIVNAIAPIAEKLAASPNTKVGKAIFPSAGFSRLEAKKAENFARPSEFSVGEIVRHTSDGGEYRILEPAGEGYYRIQRGREMPVTAPVSVLARVPAKQKGRTIVQDAPPRSSGARGDLEDRARMLGIADLSGTELELADRIAAKAQANAAEQPPGPRPRSPLTRYGKPFTPSPLIPRQETAPEAAEPAAAPETPAPESMAQPEPTQDAPGAVKASIPEAAPTAPSPSRKPLLPGRRAAEELAAEFPTGDYLAKSEASIQRGGVVYQIIDRSQTDQKLPRGGVVVRALNGPKVDKVLHLTLEQARELERFDDRDLGAMEERAMDSELRKSGEVKSLIGEIKRLGGIRIGRDVRRDLRNGPLKDLIPPPGLFVNSSTASSLDEMAGMLGYQEIDDLVEDLKRELETGKPVYYEGVKSARYSLPEKRRPLLPSKGRVSAGKFSVPREPIRLRYAEGSTMARAAARQFLNQPLLNRSSKVTATVSGESLGEMLAASTVGRSLSPQAHMQAVANLDHLFPLAVLRESRDDKKRIFGLKRLHHFEVPMPFNGELLRVRIMAKEFSRADQGTRLYLVRAVEIEKPASLRGEPTSPDSLASTVSVPNAGFEDEFSTLLDAVKRGEVFEGFGGPAPAESQAGPKGKASLPSRRADRETPAEADPEGTSRIERAFGERGLSVQRAAEHALKYWPAGGRPAEDIIGTIPEGQQYLQRVERAWWETRRKIASWSRGLTAARHDLDRADRLYIRSSFMRDYEQGGVGQQWQSEAVAEFARAWRDTNATVADEAGRLIESFQGRDADTYVPHRLTDKGRAILQKQNGSEWDALVEQAQVNGIDVTVLYELRQAPLQQQKYGSIDYARIANLPWEVTTAAGKTVKILETDPEVLFSHIRSAARRLSTIEQFGTDAASQEYMDAVAHGLVYAGADTDTTKEAVSRIWKRLEGQDAMAGRELFGKFSPAWQAVDSVVAALNLSGAVVGNLVGGHLPESVRMGLVPTARAFVYAYTHSLKNPDQAELLALVDLEGDLLHDLASTETLEGKVARGAGKVLVGTGFVSVNRRINFAVARAMQRENLRLMLEAVATEKSGTWEKFWGKDAGAARRYLTEELRFSEQDVERMALEGPTDQDMARAIGKELELVNAMNESPGSRPKFVAHPLWRMGFAYSTFVRKMYDTTKFAAREARAGNVRPLATLLVAGNVTGEILRALKDLLKDREDEEKGFLERLVANMLEVGALGLSGSLSYAIKRIDDPKADFFSDAFKPPHFETIAALGAGLYRSVRDVELKPLWKATARVASGVDIIDKQATRRGLFPSRRTIKDEDTGATVTATRRQREYASRLVDQVYVRRTTRNGIVRNPLDPVPSKFRPATTRRLVDDLRADGLNDEQILTLIEDARATRAREK